MRRWCGTPAADCPAGTGAYQLTRRELKEFTEYEAVPYDHGRVNPEFKRLRITTAPEDLTRLAMPLTGEANMVDVPKVLHQQAINEGMEIFESPLPSVCPTLVFPQVAAPGSSQAG